MTLNPLKLFILTALGYAGFVLVTSSSATAAPVLPDVPQPEPTSPPKPTARQLQNSFPLKKGSRGDLVVTLQKHLGINADGIFGAQTENALLQQHGVSRILSLVEFNRLIGSRAQATQANNTTKPIATAPATSQPVITTAHKPTVPAQKPVTTRPVTPARPVSPPVTAHKPTTTAGKLVPVNVSIQELGKVFDSVWTTGIGVNANSYHVRVSIDKATITKVLAGKSDLQLGAFIRAYNERYKTKPVYSGKRTQANLLADMKEVTTAIRGASYNALLARVDKLAH